MAELNKADQAQQVFDNMCAVLDAKNKRLDLAIATCVASYGLSDGSFDYDITTGRIFFRLTVCFRNSTIGDGLFTYLVGVSSAVVDKYNDKFFAISKGLLSVDDFIVSEQ